MSDIKDKRIELLQNRINQYGMRFPVAMIAGRTKFDRGYISAVLNGKKPMSDNFWSRFDKEFPDKTAEKLTGEIQQTVNSGNDHLPDLTTLLTQLMQKQNSLMELQNKILAEQKEDLIDKVKEIHVNSKSTIAYLQTILRVNR